jgi:hypothetical protein
MAVARYDKYDPYGGGFRAPLDLAWVAADVGKVWAVGLNAAGRVVKGAGQTGITGVLIINEALPASAVVDVMTHGEITNFNLQSGSAAAAGTTYFGVAADGTFNATNTGTKLGYTVEADRLVVRCIGRVAALTTT